MNNESGWTPEPGSEGDGTRDREPIPDLLRRLAGDARAFAGVETARYRLRAGFIATNLRTMAIAGAMALFLLFALVVAALVSLFMILTGALGGWGALGAVLGGGVLLLLLCGAVVMRAVGRIKRIVKP